MEIPDNVTGTGGYLFEYCKALESVFIGKNATNIAGTFSGSSSLASITVDAENKSYSSVDGVLFDKEKTLIIKYPASKPTISYTISNTVLTVGQSCFGDSVFLESVIIPDNVTIIEHGAFSGSKSLYSVSIGKSVKCIEDYAFNRCTSLVSITIPQNVLRIGYAAFVGCDSLKTVYIERSAAMGITEIWYYAFGGKVVGDYPNYSPNLSPESIYVPNQESVTAYKNAKFAFEYKDRIKLKP